MPKAHEDLLQGLAIDEICIGSQQDICTYNEVQVNNRISVIFDKRDHGGEFSTPALEEKFSLLGVELVLFWWRMCSHGSEHHETVHMYMHD